MSAGTVEERLQLQEDLIAIHVDGGAMELHADAGGRYDCKYVRTADGWRFAEVELHVFWRSDESFVIQPKD
jgi:uncharacterized protein YjhX (UPF0386 family)